MISVYTDGACSCNGFKGAKAGIGIFFGENDIRNVSERVIGKQTNNVAELTALIRVSEILEKEIERGDSITIYSDSQYAIRCCSSYGEKVTNSKKLRSKPVPNIELVIQAYSIYSKCPSVSFVYVRAHTGKQDSHSIGNDWADRLANLSIGITSQPERTKFKHQNTFSNPDNAVFISVPYKEKEHVKNLGGRWNRDVKSWYFTTDLCENKQREILSRWKRNEKV